MSQLTVWVYIFLQNCVVLFNFNARKWKKTSVEKNYDFTCHDDFMSSYVTRNSRMNSKLLNVQRTSSILVGQVHCTIVFVPLHSVSVSVFFVYFYLFFWKKYFRLQALISYGRNCCRFINFVQCIDLYTSSPEVNYYII